MVAGGGAGAGGGTEIGFREIAAELKSIKEKLKASEAKAEKDRLARLLPQPGPPSKGSRSRASQREAAEKKRIDLKIKVLEYYGLLVDHADADKTLWTARTMLDTAGTPPLPIDACTLAHIWPEEKKMLASAIASELKLPDGFYLEPRNYLILPRDAHEGFDNESLLFLPSANGRIKVRKWRLEDRSPAEAAAVAKYDGRELSWPNRDTASPCIPFMRLLAYRMMSAGKTRPADELDISLASEQEAALNSSVTGAGNKAVRDLCLRLSLL